MRLRSEYAAWDAHERFLAGASALERPQLEAAVDQCRCGAIMSGSAEPSDCALFGKECKPDSPRGACMVSSEGACRIWHQYGLGLRNEHELASLRVRESAR